MYERKLRVRSCGVLVENDSILLVNLHSPVINKPIWTVPGGGVEFGETTRDAVEREFKEETGLEVRALEILHINELIENQFHAIEFYYKVEKITSDIKVGKDPERDENRQIITDVRYFKLSEIDNLNIAPEFLKNLAIL